MFRLLLILGLPGLRRRILKVAFNFLLFTPLALIGVYHAGMQLSFARNMVDSMGIGAMMVLGPMFLAAVSAISLLLALIFIGIRVKSTVLCALVMYAALGGYEWWRMHG